MGRLAKLIPLKDSPWAFASQRLRSEWYRVQEALSSSKLDKLNSDRDELLKKGVGDNLGAALKLVTESTQLMLEDMRTRSAPEWAMRESLLGKLREGKLEAWGVETGPHGNRQLEVIPEHFFVDAKTNWN